MASILDVSVSSDSEDDADYVPTGDVAPSESSGDENISEDELDIPKPKRAKTKRSAKSKKDEEEKHLAPVNDSKNLNVDPKKHADDIWASFLKDVESSSDIKSSRASSSDVKSTKAASVDETKIESATVAVPEKSEVQEEAPKVPTAKVFEFAGETFRVDDFSHVCGKPKFSETASASEVKESPPKKRGGIDSVLGTLLNKKQKVTTLQKTLYDWKSFKRDEGIEEDLEQYNKGRNGFIERQRFLQRSDVRSFEAEKSIRQLKKKK